MLRRPGCLAPISMVFVGGCLLLVGGLMAESARAIQGGVGCLLAAAALVGAGMWMRHYGWWD
jgi:hypothetical protein